MTARSALCALFAIAVMAACASSAVADVPGHGRAWELVTPPDDPIAASPSEIVGITDDGGRIAYASHGPMPGALAGDLLGNNLATRGADGWSTTPISFPYTLKSGEFSTVGRVALSDDLRTSIWSSTYPLVPGGPPQGTIGWYRRDPQGNLQLLAATGVAENVFPRPSTFGGASADTGTVVVASADPETHLLPSDAGRERGRSIYEVGDGTLRQVDVDSSGNLLSSCGSVVSQVGGVSRSGARVFFTNPAPELSCEPSSVYLRSGGTTTVEISASQCDRSDCGEDQPAIFAGATPSGATAFIASAQQLTDDDLDTGSDLYRYDVDSGDLTLLSAALEGESGDATSDPVRVSEDGSRVYFHSRGKLLPGPGSADGENLYLAEGSELRFVAPSEGKDLLQISPDGRIAMFETAVPLVGSDNDEQVDVYRFDAEADTVTQLSIGPSGGNGPIGATIEVESSVLVDLPDELRSTLSDDGEHLFFSTAEGLVPADSGDGEDVYEWSGGTVELISQGAGSTDAQFRAISGDGSTVAFKTAASLLPRDRDGGDFDLYVARIGGGFPEAPAPSDCAAGGCDPPALTQRAGRPAPATVAALRTKRRKRMRLKPLGRSAGERLVASGRLVLEVTVPAPGRVFGTMSIAAGSGRRTIARGIGGAVRPGPLRIVLHVTLAAPRSPVTGRTRRARLVLRQADLRLTRSVLLTGVGR